ncbi:MAG: ABC-F family ATP-binding cassette domain-containing protein, partial [Clostridia bacterium]|nr:ABC-F family ATP-binding cassette domain-containing protein [Clostridia bacterium]
MRISIVNGSIEFDGETLLSEINFEINDKEKIAIVGRNGCGKTSLLRALTGELELIKGVGEENFGFYTTGKPRLGYLNQVSFNGSTGTLYQEMLLAYPDVIATEKDMEDALNLLQSNSTDEKLISRYALLRERYEALGGYVYKNECKVALNKFGFTENEQNRSISEFSGGQKTKIALLKLLLSRPDILILDEPTNHLDVEAVAWLEEYLINYKGAMIIVSHDRMFLDKIVNVVYEIEYGEMTRYKGNYTAFSEQKRMNYEKRLKDATSKAKEIARLQKIV